MSFESGLPRVIAVSSGKGGVGKTFYSIHLAARAAAKNMKVLLIDADLGLANVDVMLGLSAKGSVKQVLDGEVSLGDMVISTKAGFDVLPGGSGLYELTTLNTQQQQIMLDEIRETARDYDLILIDTGAGIGENVLYFIAAAESALILLTPDPTSLTDAYALIKVLSRQRGVRRFMVAINQANDMDGQMTFRRLLSVTDRYLDVHLDYVGHMSPSKLVRESIRKQQLLDSTSAPIAVQELHHVLDQVLQQPRDSSRSSGLQFFWEHSLNLDSAVQAGG